jgi:outer membrane protein assembly factor BamE
MINLNCWPETQPENTNFKPNSTPLAIALTLILTSCGSWLPDAHRIDVTQGNTIERNTLETIHLGMKRSEITPILGNPLINDPFHAQRWDYIYRFTPGRGEPIQSRLTLFFKGDELIRIDDSEYVEPVPETIKEE